ncbi:MAG: tyrosinase family protein [Alphaproteobacteria bacterium]|nr:tyrosinase family protein [Alphaproteobacteria bacterium]
MFHSSASPNDPMFFLHHANVDRVWAAWQEENRLAGGALAEDYGNPGYPDMWRGELFIWDQVDAAEMFDYRALGYEYDALPTPQ